MQFDQGQVGAVQMPVDSRILPKVTANPKAKALLDACAAAFTWGASQGTTGSADNPPMVSSFTDSKEKELVKASALAGQFTENTSKSYKYSDVQKKAYAVAYGQALAAGLEDSLAKRTPSFKAPAGVDPQVTPNLQAIYAAAFGVYGTGTSGAGENPDKQTASNLGQSLLIALGVTAVIGAGLWYWTKKVTPQTNPSSKNPSEMKLYQINDEDESVTLEEFLSDNRELDPEDVEKIKSLKVEETGHFGGGGWAEWKIRRVY